MAETNGLWEKGHEAIKLTNVILQLERSVKVRYQVVVRTMHHFTVEVKEASIGKKLYKAKVWAVWKNFKQLQSFKPIRDAAAT